MTREERALVRLTAEKMSREPEQTPVALMGKGWITLLDEIDELETRHEQDKHRMRLLESKAADDFVRRQQLEGTLAAVMKAAKDYLDGWDLTVSDEEHGEREQILRYELAGDAKEIAEVHDAWIATKAVNAHVRQRLDELLAGAKGRDIEIDALIAKSDVCAAEQREKLLAEGAAAERAKFDHLCKLVMRQRRARALDAGEGPWTDELAEAEANLTDAMARIT